MREFSVPASFAVEENDNIVSSVYSYERDHPDRVIFQRLVGGVWTDVTCAQAAEQIRSTALGLIAEGVNAGDRVAIVSATRYEWVILDYAILSVGALTVLIYDTSSAEQVRWVLEDSGAVLVVTETDAHAQLVKELSAELPSLRKILRLESAGGPGALDELADSNHKVFRICRHFHGSDPGPLETFRLGRANAPGRSLTCPFACHQGVQRLAGQGWPKAIAKRP